jgi:uncharacterized membrane protein HdeD (DUF308 family)
MVNRSPGYHCLVGGIECRRVPETPGQRTECGPRRVLPAPIIGVLSLVLAIFIFVSPVATLNVLVILVGAIALLAGLVMVLKGLRLRKRMAVNP